ncbi:putative Thaumatin family [Dioscorea sansibarensis]
MKFLISFLILLSCQPLTLGRVVEGETVSFHVKNKCPFPIWPATAPNTGHPVIADGGFYLPSGKAHRVIAPPNWNGRFWARTGCNFSSGSSPACQTGDCQSLLACNGTIGLPPATLVEVNLVADSSKPSFYDVSLVDGYNVPVAVSTVPSNPKCMIQGCKSNINSVCPQELQVTDKIKGDVVACKSACLAFNLDLFCCRNSYGKAEKCKPSMYSKMFKDACPSYFSYAFDTPTSLVSCASKEFLITFCPDKWNGDHQYSM